MCGGSAELIQQACGFHEEEHKSLSYPIANEFIINLQLTLGQIQINESDYLGTMLSLLDRDMQNNTAQLRQPHTTQWATTPTNVNAFHTFQSNAISGFKT